MMGAVLYCNDGDWVESCTALTEDAAGQLSLLRWTETSELLRQGPVPAADSTSPPLDQAA